VIKPRLWLPPVVFVATSIPAVLVLQALGWGDEYRLWIAIGIGGVATAFAQSRLARQALQKPQNKENPQP
jgi:hypothetical protein